MAAINFNTANQTLRQLLGNGLTYQVPRFQRDYSWTEEEWEDLWEDILGTLAPEGEPAHYMGYLVLQTSDNKQFDIIDGQQRLTTLSLLILAILKNLQALIHANIDADNNQRRLDQLRNSYIGFLDPVTLIPRSKLSLNRNNDRYFQNYLVPLERLPQRNLKASEHLLRKAFEWFQDAVNRQYGQEIEGREFAQFIDTISDKLFFTVITVTDELNAFKVFETLNARGVRLSSTDLLKNYLFSVVYKDGAHEHEINTLEQQWELIIGQLGSENFPDFLRVHWNSRHQFVRQAELFKTIRGQIRDKGQTFQLLRQMEEDASTFAALSQPEDALWDIEQREHIAELRFFYVRQPYPLLLAARRALSNTDFTTLLRACSIISFRYNAIGSLAPNEQERVYNAAAKAIADGELTKVYEILRSLRAIYPSDDTFRNAFAEKQLKTTQSRNSGLVRYILFRIEQHVTNQEYDTDSDLYTIEHILPENPNEGWSQFSDDEVERFVYRLGNMTLLQAAQNRELGNRPFTEKREVYRTSDFEITRKVAEENSHWGSERIATRQRWMAKQAVSIWRIAQLA